MMDTKYLSVLSFQRDQMLLNLINKLLIHLKLKAKGIDDQIKNDEIIQAKETLSYFLINIVSLVKDIETKGNEPLVGVDMRLRSLAREFAEAKRKKSKFKSELFKGSSDKILENLKSYESAEPQVLIDALTELRILIEEHISVDKKDLIQDI